jgi:hypothetical protein
MRKFIININRVIKSRRMKLALAEYAWENEKCTENFTLNPEGQRPLATCRLRWKDNIKMDLK